MQTWLRLDRPDLSLQLCEHWDQARAHVGDGLRLALAAQTVPTSSAGDVEGAQCLRFLRRWCPNLERAVLLAPRSVPQALPADLEALPLELGSPHLLAHLQGWLPAPSRKGPHELVVCSPDGEIVRAENSRDPERRSDLLAFLAHKGQQLATAIGESALDRLSLQGSAGEVEVVLGAERQWFAARRPGDQTSLSLRDADVEVVWSTRN